MANLDEKERIAVDVGRTMKAHLPKGVGFCLMLFDFGKAGHTTYVSNAERRDMIEALRETADRLEHGLTAPLGQPNHPHNRRNEG